jgi:hypothetical protein
MKREVNLKPWRVAALVMLMFGMAACAGESRSDGDDAGESSMAAETGEHAEGGEGVEASEGSERGEERGEEPGEEHAEGGESREGGEGEGEHSQAREGGEHDGEEGGHEEGGEEGEEPGIYIERGETWDKVRRGARLVLSYNAERGAFVGRVENTTNERLCAVRVEVHVGGGPELGPTARTDVPAGGTIDVVLPAEGASIDTWTAHPELSACSGE